MPVGTLNGKIVYRAYSEFSYSDDLNENFEYMDCNHSIPNIKQILSYKCVMSSVNTENSTTYELPYIENGVAKTYVQAINNTNARIFNKANWAGSSYICKLIVYYTKE